MISNNKNPTGLVYYTNNTSQSCFERNRLLTLDEVMACETENFLEYLDLLAEKAVLMRSRENPDRGLIIKHLKRVASMTSNQMSAFSNLLKTKQ